MKRGSPLVLLAAALSALVLAAPLAASTWEGSAVVGGLADFPTNGLFAACNSFPRDASVEVRNVENGKVVVVTITKGVDNPGVFIALSPKAAEELGMRAGVTARVRAVALSRLAAPISPAKSLPAESADPDVNPRLLAPAPSAESADRSPSVPAAEAGVPAAAAKESAAPPAPAPAPAAAAEELASASPVAQRPARSEAAVGGGESLSAPALPRLPEIETAPPAATSPAASAPPAQASPAEAGPPAAQPEPKADAVQAGSSAAAPPEFAEASRAPLPAPTAPAGPLPVEAAPLEPERAIVETTRSAPAASAAPTAVTEPVLVIPEPEAVPSAVPASPPSPESSTPTLAEASLPQATPQTPLPPAPALAAPEAAAPSAAPAPSAEEPASMEVVVALEATAPRPPLGGATAPAATPAPAPAKPAAPAEMGGAATAAAAPKAPASPPAAARGSAGDRSSRETLLARLVQIERLEKERHYLQLGSYGSEEGMLAALAPIAGSYPLAVQAVPGSTSPAFRLFIGPLARDEAGALLLKARTLGFKDAFVRKGE